MDQAERPPLPEAVERQTASPEQQETEHGPAPGRFSRRAFLAQLGAAGVAATTGTMHAAAQAESPEKTEEAGAVPVTLLVNGREYSLNLEPRVTLLDALRERLHLYGTKKGCDHGQCGACTVHVNGRRVNSCLSFAIMHQGDRITTIEGLAHHGELAIMQQSFIVNDGFQCGYCTPGQIMSATALLSEPIGPGDDEVRAAMSGNICRCGAYDNIVTAVQEARKASRTA
ncbi:MAG TPA: (2Fe-2S)-binding protein [Acidobacteriaceae bacterium]|nr:(2Fe-2S)-binding protein [Acidobacteriaceae bacterium]